MTAMTCSIQSVLAQVPRIAVSVNGVAIPHDAIARELQHHPESTPARAWQQAARALVVRELLLQEARRLGLQPACAVDAEGRCETDEEALVRRCPGGVRSRAPSYGHPMTRIVPQVATRMPATKSQMLPSRSKAAHASAAKAARARRSISLK
jgi:hypothetical protein